jgi:hypothetical protein
VVFSVSFHKNIVIVNHDVRKELQPPEVCNVNDVMYMARIKRRKDLRRKKKAAAHLKFPCQYAHSSPYPPRILFVARLAVPADDLAFAGILGQSAPDDRGPT